MAAGRGHAREVLKNGERRKAQFIVTAPTRAMSAIHALQPSKSRGMPGLSGNGMFLAFTLLHFWVFLILNVLNLVCWFSFDPALLKHSRLSSVDYVENDE